MGKELNIFFKASLFFFTNVVKRENSPSLIPISNILFGQSGEAYR